MAYFKRISLIVVITTLSLAVIIGISLFISKDTSQESSKTTPSLRDSDNKHNKKLPETINMLAIGDYGSTVYKAGSCCNRYRKTLPESQAFYKDFWAQRNIATLMAQSAKALSPDVIIGHGDNFYWNGLGAKDRDARFAATFEDMYDHPELEGIKWINVVGNHDLGGSNYLCGDADEKFHECESIEAMKAALIKKFELQQTYRSPNHDRWILKDHYYKYTIERNGIKVEIFNIDTNFADSHGAKQICCQCYGYSPKDWDGNCNNVAREHKYCAGGDTKAFDACMDIIEEWWNDSIRQLKRDLGSSTADFKIVNSHYSPFFHMSPEKRKVYLDILKEGKVHVFLNGHTHGENHDYADFGTHFFENGAGGGIQSEASGAPNVEGVENIWIGNDAPYGFFELSASKHWLQLRFITFDKDWVFNTDVKKIKVGGGKVDHCWVISSTLGRGYKCGSETEATP